MYLKLSSATSKASSVTPLYTTNLLHNLWNETEERTVDACDASAEAFDLCDKHNWLRLKMDK